MTVSITVKPGPNFRKFQNLMKRAPKKIKKARDHNLKKVGLLVQRESMRNAKKKTGALERAIRFQVKGNIARVYVPSNSEAGQYAKRQHDVIKGRGPGTKQKGPRAGWKFIRRGIDDNKVKIERIMRTTFKPITKGRF